jgi:hypothetical protein
MKKDRKQRTMTRKGYAQNYKKGIILEIIAMK